MKLTNPEHAARVLAHQEAQAKKIAQGLIVVEQINPPVPSTQFDWQAYIRDEEEGGPYGRGPTRSEALLDLCEQLALLWLEAR